MDRIFDVDLAAHAPTGRVRAWKQLLDENVMGVDCRNAGEDMQASLKTRLVDSGLVARSRFTRQTMFRTPALIRQASEETTLIVFVQEGTHVIRQGHKSATLDGSGIYILDSSRPFEVDFASDEIKQGALNVPRAAITKRIGAIEDIAFASSEPLQRLLSTFANGVIQSFETLDAETLDALLNHVLDLFAMMVAQRKSSSIDPSTHQAGMLLRIKAYINAHLRDDELTFERTARALGISSRYVNALFAIEGTSYGRYVLAQRLEAARREIMDPRLVRRQVSEIAFDWGFKDASHFGRVFRERFGMAPRDAKPRTH